jgi:uncharacterized protein
MAKMIFVNLPVADVAASTAFYEAIGFTRDPRFSGEHAVSMIATGGVVVGLLTQDFYRTLTPKRIADARTESQMLLALSCDTRDAVDAIAAAALAAGGREAHGAEDQGFMYSRGFEDPDGHGWGPFWMDPSALAPEQAEAATA